MMICDFCGRPRALTVQSKTTGHVVCSACAWAVVEQLVQHRAMPHAARCEPLDPPEAVTTTRAT